jgi:hypothetical protein
VADEDVVLDRDSFTDERVARYLAALADGGILLNFNECSDLGFIADFASVEVDELGEFDVPSELYIRRDAYKRIHSDEWPW